MCGAEGARRTGLKTTGLVNSLTRFPMLILRSFAGSNPVQLQSSDSGQDS